MAAPPEPTACSAGCRMGACCHERQPMSRAHDKNCGRCGCQRAAGATGRRKAWVPRPGSGAGRASREARSRCRFRTSAAGRACQRRRRRRRRGGRWDAAQPPGPLRVSRYAALARVGRWGADGCSRKSRWPGSPPPATRRVSGRARRTRMRTGGGFGARRGGSSGFLRRGWVF